MGETHDAVLAQPARGEDNIDVVIMVGDALGKLADQGKIALGTRVDLVRSLIGACGRGRRTPTSPRLRRCAARCWMRNRSPTPTARAAHVSTELLKRFGIADQAARKARMIPATPVAEIVAKGEAEIGFQQIAEPRRCTASTCSARFLPSCRRRRSSPPASLPIASGGRGNSVHRLPGIAGSLRSRSPRPVSSPSRTDRSRVTCLS